MLWIATLAKTREKRHTALIVPPDSPNTAVGGVHAAQSEDPDDILHAKLRIAVLKDLCLSAEIEDTEHAPDHIGGGGTIARACDAHVKHADKQQIQHKIDAAFRYGKRSQDF